LVNATAGHALDFDDVSHAMKGHPSTVLVPALLAASSVGRVSGVTFAEAYVVGLQVNAAVWAAVGATHYERGWHATSTVGVFGATAAVARIRNLSVEGTTTALGIAGSFAAGTRQNFGSMTKPLHAGHAAEWAVRAVELTGLGLTANLNVLDGDLGFLALTGSPDVASGRAVLEGDWILGGPRGLNVKQYACCYFAHRAVDALRRLPEESAAEIAGIEVFVPPGTLSALRHPDPTDGLEGKFSGPYILAAAILDGALGPGSFTDAAVRRPEHRELARRITWIESERPPVGDAGYVDGYAVVRRTSRDGSVAAARIDAPVGHALNPLDDEALIAKAVDAVRFGAPDADVDALTCTLLHLENTADVAAWSEALRNPVSSNRKEQP
jgi:2-methylcitrate dehydratase PrpD